MTEKTWYLSNKIKNIEAVVEVARKLGFSVIVEPIEMGWTKFTILECGQVRDDFYERMQLVYIEFSEV